MRLAPGIAPKEPGYEHTDGSPLRSGDGRNALVIIFSLLLAKCEDEARSMVQETRQLHYGSEVE